MTTAGPTAIAGPTAYSELWLRAQLSAFPFLACFITLFHPYCHTHVPHAPSMQVPHPTPTPLCLLRALPPPMAWCPVPRCPLSTLHFAARMPAPLHVLPLHLLVSHTPCSPFVSGFHHAPCPGAPHMPCACIVVLFRATPAPLGLVPVQCCPPCVLHYVSACISALHAVPAVLLPHVW